MNILISFGRCSAPKLSKCVTFPAFIYNAVQSVTIDSYSLRFIIYSQSLILDQLFLK